MSCETEVDRTNLYTAKVFLFLPDPKATIEAGYNRIAIARSRQGGLIAPNFVEITNAQTEIVIQEGVYNYAYIDGDAEAHWLYKPILRDSTAVKPDVPQVVRPAVDGSFEAVLSVEELRTLYLFGIDLTDDAGRPYPAELFAHYIKAAISELEHEADIALLPTKVIERHDFYRRDYENYCFLKLLRKPVIQVDKVSIEYPLDSEVVAFDKSWVRLDKHAGQIQILPAKGTFTQSLVSAGGGYLPLVFGGADFIPDLFRVEYFAGFPLGQIPELLKKYVGHKAAMGPLNIAGDLVAGAGIMSKSLSIDGLSSSLSTTNSSTNAGYGARLLEYRKTVKEDKITIQRFYSGGRMSVVS